jgi:hypothetical protein
MPFIGVRISWLHLQVDLDPARPVRPHQTHIGRFGGHARLGAVPQRHDGGVVVGMKHRERVGVDRQRGFGADQLRELRRQPELAARIVVFKHPGAGGVERQVETLGVGGGLVAGLGQGGDALAEPVHLIEAGRELGAGAVVDAQMGPSAVGRQVAHLPLRRPTLVDDALADGLVLDLVVGMLDRQQHRQGHRLAVVFVAQGELAGEIVDLGVGIVAPGADLRVVHQPVAGALGDPPLLHRPARFGEVGQEQQGAAFIGIETEPDDPLAAAGRGDAEHLAVAGFHLDGAAAFENLAQTATGNDGEAAEHGAEALVRGQNPTLGVEHGHGHRQGVDGERRGR